MTQFDYEILGIRKYESFIYSIVKAVNVYRPKNVLKSLFEEDGLLLEELINFLRRKISQNGNNAIKIHENASFIECIMILERINKGKIEFKWKYNKVFE